MERGFVRINGGVFSLADGPEFVQEGGLGVKFIVTPNTGSRMVGVTAGFHQPGQSFQPHTHPISEELLIVVKGRGEIYLKDRWIPVKEGDIVYAPEGVPHGTRNPADNTEVFVTIGVASPPQLDLYHRSGYVLHTEERHSEGPA